MKNKQPELWEAVGSARYILEDLNTVEGMQEIVKLTGLPIGVVSSAFKNIFECNLNESVPQTPDPSTLGPRPK